MQNRRKFLVGTVVALGWNRLSPLLTLALSPALAQGQNKSPQGSTAGQTLNLEVPTHPANVILGRPTQRSITANVLAYQDGEGYLQYGYPSGDILGSSGHLRVSVQPSSLKVEYIRSYLAKGENNSRKNRSVGHSYTLVDG